MPTKSVQKLLDEMNERLTALESRVKEHERIIEIQSPGPKGDTGEQGATGPKGAQGEKGSGFLVGNLRL